MDSGVEVTLLIMIMIVLLYAIHEFYERWIPRAVRKSVALQLITMGLAIFGDTYAAATGSTVSTTIVATSLLVLLGELSVHRSIASVIALARLVAPPTFPVLTASLLLSALTEGSIEYLKRKHRAATEKGTKSSES